MCRSWKRAIRLLTSNGWKPTDLGFTGAQRREGLRRQRERRNQMTKPNANGSNPTIIHMSLQGKGGVGKSLVSAILSQYLASRGQDIHGIDADPVNHTLSE